MNRAEKYFKDQGIEMWSEETIEDFRLDLLTWYDANKRDLPWRKTLDPYKIWVSEIMLQQTQVQTVIPYWERFINEIPDVESLATYPEDALLKLWEGLGYYSRVKNMQFAARQIQADYGGDFPTSYKDLLNLKGIGPYTAGAIASISFKEPVPAVDGNAMRVFARLFEIGADIAKAKTKGIFEDLISVIIDPDRPGDFNQAIMDNGATISMPKVYLPEEDPLLKYNRSYHKGTWQDYPVKKSKVKQKEETYFALAIQDQEGKWFVQKRPSDGLLADMWTFPLLAEENLIGDDWKGLPPSSELPVLDEKDRNRLEEEVADEYQIQIQVGDQALGQVKHVFSHRIWNLTLYPARLEAKTDLALGEWIGEEDFPDYTFPGPQQKMWTLIKKFKT